MARVRAYLKSDAETKRFVKALDSIDHSRSTWEVFDDFTTMAACAISNTADKMNFDMREMEYERIRKRYSTAQMEGFAELFALTVLAIAENPDRDFLGDLYSGLDLLNRQHQQFFTPYHITKFMVLSALTGKEKAFEKEGYIKVCDPCCGAGAMLIAFANVMREKNMNPETDALIVGQDIDMRVAKMCYISLSLMGCSAIVKVGNSLSLEDVPIECTWGTPMFFKNDIWVERGYTVRNSTPQKVAA